MAYKRHYAGYYLTAGDDPTGLAMVLTGPWKPEYKNVISSEGVAELRLNDFVGWTDTEIGFLTELRTLRAIGIYNWRVTDIRPLTQLKELERLGLECNYKNSPDFSAFPKLRDCYLRWRHGSDSVFRAKNLQFLNIVTYPYVDLTPLHDLRELRQLKLSSAKLKTLKGISALPDLSRLDLYLCTKLESLAEIDRCSKLTEINIETCKRIGNIELIGKLNNLKILRLTNCGVIKSLLPLKNCKKLEELFFIEGTVIEDGDLSFFQELPMLKHMWFMDRKHYSHGRDQIGLAP